ncbi:MAG: hypothetical protein N2Z80_00210 [Hydrogenothermaceae bacterium]|nr:hypothetical protein [Hydrogenothermaceae bacterium]
MASITYVQVFKKLGIRILSSISGDSTFREITYAHRAKLNVVICSKALVSLAEAMEERYNIPYLEGSFYGIQEITKTLRTIADYLDDEALKERVYTCTEMKERETKRS